MLTVVNAGVAEMEDALGLDPSLGCPVGRSTSHCEFESRRPHHFVSQRLLYSNWLPEGKPFSFGCFES